MVTVSNIKVYDLEECICAARNPMRTTPSEYTADDFKASLERAKKLATITNNSAHINFLKGIRVSFDITYPQYFAPQLQRYLFIDIVSSSSKDHRLAHFIKSDSFNKYVTPEIEQCLLTYVNAYYANPTYENYMIMLSNCPLGLQLFMRVSTNYMCLRNLYLQRKEDKLKEDWGTILDMIRELPYANEFLTLGK